MRRTYGLLVVLSLVTFGGCQGAPNVANVPTGGSGVAVPKVVQTGGDDSWARFLLHPNDSPVYITTGPDGNMWSTNYGSGHNSILSITMAGVVTRYTLTGGLGYPLDIVAGPDHALWFTEQAGIGRITTVGTDTHYPLQGFDTGFITSGPDGNLWFTAIGGSTGYIGRITTGGVITLYALGVSDFVGGIVTGPDGNIWFTVTGTRKVHGNVGRIMPDGSITMFPADPSGPRPSQIVLAGDHQLYYLDGGYRQSLVRVNATTGATTVIGRFKDPINLVPIGQHFIWYMSNCHCTLTPSVWAISLTTGFNEEKIASPYGSVLGRGARGPDGNFWIASEDGSIDVAIRKSMLVSPLSLTMFPTEGANVSVSERFFSGLFTATSGNTSILKIVTNNPSHGPFGVQARATGSTTLTLQDTKGNVATIPVTVSN